jgi:hypothetical protein
MPIFMALIHGELPILLVAQSLLRYDQNLSHSEVASGRNVV